jgi:hypothetical protein
MQSIGREASSRSALRLARKRHSFDTWCKPGSGINLQEVRPLVAIEARGRRTEEGLCIKFLKINGISGLIRQQEEKDSCVMCEVQIAGREFLVGSGIADFRLKRREFFGVP